ncbi:hypothetical protein H6784_02800 [Candidatus Nomurabacteria bacterium]|nr:hypothetical protein [Candidatus Kaiserbacteria bacterium]MCB9814325.1 hypothetical protein [Candidatus Nomurabacteria bacterium]
MSQNIKNLHRTLLNTVVSVLAVASVLGVIYSTQVDKVESSAGDNVAGYAWSDTIGWISMNCTNDGSCGTSNYGVRVDGSGNLSGYAWSDNIGWITFNPADLSGCPLGSCAPVLDPVAGLVSGWARALSPLSAGANAGGWDGWISLSAAGVNGVKSNSPAASCSWSGFAWGSNVVGWVDFGQVTGTGDACLSPSGSIDASSCTIANGNSTCDSTVTWTSANFVGATSVTQNASQFSSNSVGSEVRPVDFGSTVFKLDDLGDPFYKEKTLNIGCAPGGAWAVGNTPATCLLLPTVSIVTNSDFVRNGEKAHLDIEIKADYDMQCELYGVETAANSPVVFNHTAPAVVGDTKNYPYDTLALTSTQIVRVECVLVGSPLLTDSDQKRIDVTASVEER